MKIAIPVHNGKLSDHFGHAELFRFYSVDINSKKILEINDLTPPPHEPGVIPKWIADNCTTILMVRGIGQKAISILNRQGVQVITGVEHQELDNLVNSFLNGTLKQNQNSCNH